MNNPPKYVVSTTLSEITWNATLMRGEMAEALYHPGTLMESGYMPVNGLDMYYEIHGNLSTIGKGLFREEVAQ